MTVIISIEKRKIIIIDKTILKNGLFCLTCYTEIWLNMLNLCVCVTTSYTVSFLLLCLFSPSTHTHINTVVVTNECATAALVWAVLCLLSLPACLHAPLLYWFCAPLHQIKTWILSAWTSPPHTAMGFFSSMKLKKSQRFSATCNDPC